MNKAVFLDRDGVINDGTAYYTYEVESFIFNDGLIEGLKLLVKDGFILIVITNQSGVAKKQYTIEQVNKVHDYMISVLKRHGIIIQAVYVCPHHPDVQTCECRKPKSKLFEQAIFDFEIDVSKSFMIGDSIRDVQAAENVNVQAFKIEKNQNIIPVCNKIIELSHV